MNQPKIKRPRLFHANPWDIVMDACMRSLQTRDPRFVGATYYSSMAAKLIQDTGATQRDLHQGLRDFPERKLPGPSTNLSAMIALITVNWRTIGVQHDAASTDRNRRHFGHPELPSGANLSTDEPDAQPERAAVSVGDEQPPVGDDGREVPGVREGTVLAVELPVDGEREQHSGLHTGEDDDGQPPGL